MCSSRMTGHTFLSIMQSSKDLTQEEYNEPVVYCRDCHSLYIITDEDLADEYWDGCYCGRCNSTNIGECAFGQWLDEENERLSKLYRKI